jgi:hypothetical protein
VAIVQNGSKMVDHGRKWHDSSHLHKKEPFWRQRRHRLACSHSLCTPKKTQARNQHNASPRGHLGLVVRLVSLTLLNLWLPAMLHFSCAIETLE